MPLEEILQSPSLSCASRTPGGWQPCSSILLSCCGVPLQDHTHTKRKQNILFVDKKGRKVEKKEGKENPGSLERLLFPFSFFFGVCLGAGVLPPWPSGGGQLSGSLNFLCLGNAAQVFREHSPIVLEESEVTVTLRAAVANGDTKCCAPARIKGAFSEAFLGRQETGVPGVSVNSPTCSLPKILSVGTEPWVGVGHCPVGHG